MPLAPLRKGGLIARLSFCLLPVLELCARPAFAAANPFETALDADYGRQLLPGPDAPRPAVGALPGFAPDSADTGASPRLTAGLSLMQRDLIRRDARFSFADRNTSGGLDFTLGALPGLELRFAADRNRRELSMGDTATAVDLGGDDWGWRAAASIPVTPWIIPSVIVGGRSSSPDGNALTALAFRGSSPIGLEWSLAAGRNRLDHPVALKLRDYRPLSLPFLLRQDFRDLGLGYARGHWRAEWTGRWIESGPPRTRPSGYSLQDSSALWRQEARLAYDRLRPGAGFRAALDFNLASGDHVVQGLARKGANLYPFSWQEGRQRDYSVRADAAMGTRAGTWGAWLTGGETEYDALRPGQVFGHYLWDRNGVIDSYEGSLLGVFSDETWLMNGAAYAGQAGTGLWHESTTWGWRHRLALGYQYLLLQANSHLTRRERSLFISTSESNADRDYPTVEADLIPVALDLDRAWGPLRLIAGGQAEIPARIRVNRSGGSGSGKGGSATYGGGTTARFRLEYRLP